MEKDENIMLRKKIWEISESNWFKSIIFRWEYNHILYLINFKITDINRKRYNERNECKIYIYIYRNRF